MRTLLLILIGSVLPLQAARAQQVDSVATNAVPSVALPPALDRVLRDYEQAWRDYDAEALAALFTDDGFVLRSGHPPVRGRDAIEAAYQDAGGRLHLRALAFEQSGPTAYIIGGYTSTPKWPDAGKLSSRCGRGPTTGGASPPTWTTATADQAADPSAHVFVLTSLFSKHACHPSIHVPHGSRSSC